jgi:polysaccharide deacetylase 2 family uncharacterized protein YibQ
MSSEPPQRARPSRRPSTPALAALGLLIGLVLSAVSLFLVNGGGELRYSGVPRVELPLPPAPPPGGGAPTLPTERAVTLTEESVPPPPAIPAIERRVESAAAAQPPASSAPAMHGPPVEPDPVLTEPGPYGPLPRVGPDERTPLQVYGRDGPQATDRRPKVALLITGLGLWSAATEAALSLPSEVSLAFSPYSPDLPTWLRRARGAGHEALLVLPMEPADYPENDPGPHTLRAGAEVGHNLDRLAWVLARGSGYVGVVGGGERFGAAEAAHRPVLADLSRRGLALVELGGDQFAATAEAVGLPYVSAPQPVDADPSALAIDFVLAGLEGQALETGAAVGVAEPYPVTLERLRRWAETLESKGIVLAPVSAVLSGAGKLNSAERRGDVEPAQTPRG